MVSFLPKAGSCGVISTIWPARIGSSGSTSRRPSDGGSFALCDPVAVSGVAPTVQRWPLVLSAAFRNSLSTERFKALRWRFFRLHFQYLCAFDKPEAYDYFRITAGPADAWQPVSPIANPRRTGSTSGLRAITR